ncbi:hypothetical protein [Paenibacillus azoreducens]|uniref:Uncharacterized protein n=1 Tax=Paenibacillus azoreducens TaxID=116718 RepID=A0A920CWI3_9BACL|nr:hypothetical protein [Paenibacillus azoreducens]GIO51403.1 hypothetical protein J34TS1_61680 [Paenibacillus azoreducens]
MNQISMPSPLEELIEPLRMTNQSTSVFIETLVISGSKIAATDREKEFIIWLAQKDQNVIGRGVVGFNIEEMPWIEDDFPEMKSFMLECIRGVINKLQWELLNDEPNEQWIKDTFEHFGTMIELFEEKFVNAENYIEWSTPDEGDDHPTIPRGYPKCAEHSVYLSCFGCLICNSNKGMNFK